MLQLNNKFYKKVPFFIKKKALTKNNQEKGNIFLFLFLHIQKKKLRVLNFFKNLEKKTSFYCLFKQFQYLRAGDLLFFSKQFNNLILQKSKLLKSLTEEKKSKKVQKLRWQIKSVVIKTFLPSLYVSKKVVSLESLKRLHVYKNLKINDIKVLKRKEIALKLVKSGNLLKKNWDFRLLVFRGFLKKKKRYSSIFSSIQKRKSLWKFLSWTHKVRLLNLKKKHQKKKKVFVKIVRKRNRKKKWRRRGVFKRFRLRYRFRHKFYIPKHFEINYKTGDLIHLGYIDSSSLNFRIPFWLNLRRLVTLFSS